MKSFLFGVGIVLSLVMTSGCTGGKVVATVGQQKITRADVDFRMEVMKVFSPSFNEKAALEQLIRSATLSEIMKSKGVAIGDKEVDEELERMKKLSANNPQMGKLFSEFGSKKRFKTLYIQPMLVDRMAFGSAYQKDDAFHKEEADKVETLIRDGKANPGRLEELAKKVGANFRKGSIQERDGNLSWEADRNVASPVNLPQGAGLGQRWKSSLFEKASSGKVLETVENLGPYMMVMRLDSKDKNALKFSAAYVMKKSFGDWYNTNKANIQVVRTDEPQENAPPAPRPQ